MFTFDPRKKGIGLQSGAPSKKTGSSVSERPQHVQRAIGNQGLQQGAGFVQRLPFGITIPTGLRFLDSTEQSLATGVYGASIDFGKVLLSDAVGGGGRPFTTYVPSPIPGLSGGTVINIGPSAYATPGSDRDLLIHELGHSWQSQHHPNPAAFMANSIASQAAAAAAGGSASAYCYVPGKWFGLYGAEQIAQQVERGEAPIVAEVSSAARGSTHLGNVASLAAPHWENRGGPGVSC